MIDNYDETMALIDSDKHASSQNKVKENVVFCQGAGDGWHHVGANLRVRPTQGRHAGLSLQCVPAKLTLTKQ